MRVYGRRTPPGCERRQAKTLLAPAAAVLATLTIFLLLTPGAVSSPEWSTPLNISTTSINNHEPQIELDTAGNPHVAWYGYDGSTDRVYYSENTGGGWTAPLNISTASTENRYSKIALDTAGNPHVAWAGNDGSTHRIYYSENTGGGWTAPLNLSTTSTNNTAPQIALDTGGNPRIAWCGSDGQTLRTYYSENTGGGWTAPLNLSTTSTNNATPQIALDTGGNPRVAWRGFDGSTFRTYYSENTGSGWTAPLNLSTTSTNNTSPQIALDSGGNPRIVWRGLESSVYRIYYAENTGSGWTVPSIISATLTSNTRPGIALDTVGNPRVIWYANEGASNGTFYSENTGGGWIAPVNISTTSTNNTAPQIALDTGGNPRATWVGNDGSTYQIYYSADIRYTIYASASPPAGGTVSGAGVYDAGAFVDMHAAAGANYHFVKWTEGGVEVSSNPDYSFTATANRTLVANFALDTYMVYASVSGGHGTVIPVTQAVNHGASATVHISAAAGYQTASVTDNGAPVTPTPTPSYTIENVIGNHAVVVTFKLAASRPTIDSVTPSSGPPGTQVTLAGSNFGATRGASTVTVGGVPAQVFSWSDTKIVIIIAEGTEGGTVVVTTVRGVSNQDKEFTIGTPIWYLAEGTNAWGFSTYVTIENPNDHVLHAKLTYMDPNPEAGTGRIAERTIGLQPLSQTTVSPYADIGEVDFSTMVECVEGKTIAVDRTLYWTGTGASCPEGHNSVGVTSPSLTWYLPEGSSAWGFETWTLILNPNPTEANLTLTYMTEDSGPLLVQKKIPAYSRATYSMVADIGAHDSSIEATSDVPVIAERSQYRNNRREGSCSIGATSPSTDFFLAEGTTAWGYTTFVLVQNPNDTEAIVSVTYMTPEGPIDQTLFTMSPNSRRTIKVNDIPSVSSTDLSTRVRSETPIIAERAVYWTCPTDSAEVCHDSIGLSSPHSTFMLPDGQTSEGWETWTLVQNPNPSSVTVCVTYLSQNGGDPIAFTDEIPANSRHTYNMAGGGGEAYPGFSGRASILVQSLNGARPIMVERAMYRYGRGCGTDTSGAFVD